MKNYWLYRRGKRYSVKEINDLLLKFVGKKLNPVDELFLNMRKIVLNYFKGNNHKLKFFSDNNDPFDYNFEVEEQNGYITNVDFQV